MLIAFLRFRVGRDIFKLKGFELRRQVDGLTLEMLWKEEVLLKKVDFEVEKAEEFTRETNKMVGEWKDDAVSSGTVQVEQAADSQAQLDEIGGKPTQKPSSNWMANLGLLPKKTSSDQNLPQKRPASVQNGTSEEAKGLAAAALSAVRDAAAAAAVAAARGRVEITEVRDFAGEEIAVRKFIDVDSKEAAERAKASVGQSSGLDAVLERIKKKQKLSVLDKTKKDWGEFKEENKGMEDELDAYKKSSNQYLDKVSFLQRTDYREFERERDARLALQARRRPDMREDF
ncbi:hypothetical protein ACLOJK_021789 [Asimina triloba]